MVRMFLIGDVLIGINYLLMFGNVFVVVLVCFLFLII